MRSSALRLLISPWYSGINDRKSKQNSAKHHHFTFASADSHQASNVAASTNGFSNDQPNMTSARVEELLQQAKSKRLLVIGDLMLDEFVWGKVGRISPEAPVPVVEVTGESFYPGGAANVARNLREFVANVAVVGLFGTDRGGRQLRELLAETKIDTRNAIEDSDFPTIVKTRIIARNQQIVRVDREKILTPSSKQIAMAVDAVRDRFKETDAIIFEDYGKGFVTTELVTQIARDAVAAGKIVAADPNPQHSVDWRGVT